MSSLAWALSYSFCCLYLKKPPLKLVLTVTALFDTKNRLVTSPKHTTAALLVFFTGLFLVVRSKTGFKFMANKQFRMKKKNWEHRFALISHTMLSKTNMFNFYRKKTIEIFF